MSLSVNQNTNLTSYPQLNQQNRYICRNLPADSCSFSKSSIQNNNQTTLDKLISFAGKAVHNLSLPQIMKVITPQKPVNTLVEKEFLPKINPPKYFEEGQKGYLPSTKGYVDEAEKTSYIPATTPAPKTEQDLTAVKRALRNSYYAESFANKRMKSGINPHLGK